MTGTLLPFLVGLILLYPYLGQKSSDPNSRSDKNEHKEPILEAADEEDVTELSQLVLRKIEKIH